MKAKKIEIATGGSLPITQEEAREKFANAIFDNLYERGLLLIEKDSRWETFICATVLALPIEKNKL